MFRSSSQYPSDDEDDDNSISQMSSQLDRINEDNYFDERYVGQLGEFEFLRVKMGQTEFRAHFSGTK